MYDIFMFVLDFLAKLTLTECPYKKNKHDFHSK